MTLRFETGSKTTVLVKTYCLHTHIFILLHRSYNSPSSFLTYYIAYANEKEYTNFDWIVCATKQVCCWYLFSRFFFLSFFGSLLLLNFRSIPALRRHLCVFWNWTWRSSRSVCVCLSGKINRGKFNSTHFTIHTNTQHMYTDTVYCVLAFSTSNFTHWNFHLVFWWVLLVLSCVLLFPFSSYPSMTVCVRVFIIWLYVCLCLDCIFVRHRVRRR